MRSIGIVAATSGISPLEGGVAQGNCTLVSLIQPAWVAVLYLLTAQKLSLMYQWFLMEYPMTS